MNDATVPSNSVLENRVAALRRWLDDAALPLWWENGASHPHGGFHERIGQDGVAMARDLRRARVQPRQAYCYAAAGLRGWNGPWRQATRKAMDWFDTVYRLESGLYGNLADPDGALVDPSFDLYNQAFALFALAQVAEATPADAATAEETARNLLALLKNGYAHPLGGFEESIPPRAPLLSNPHMHLFEAALAWETVSAGDETWAQLADEIGTLAMSRFIDPQSGALREFFARDWAPLGDDRGRIVEPGHQFEWAWLLARWGERRGNRDALEKAMRLFAIGVTHGVCPERKVAIMQLNDDFSPRDPLARLWPQTEWLKSAVRLAVAIPDMRDAYLHSANDALDALDLFLATPVPGLWLDKMRPDGSMVDEPAPASTFYHIVCAIHEAEEQLARLTGQSRRA